MLSPHLTSRPAARESYPSGPGSQAEPGPAGRILIVEDTQLLLDRIAQFLCFEGHSIQTANNGHEAMAIVGESAPDLVLCDVLMPGMDGHELSRRLKSDPTTRHIPIIMISARGQQDEVIRGLEFAEEYVKKPIDLRELKARVDSMLRLKRAQDAVRELNTELEDRVRKRTVHLRRTNQLLQREVRRREESEANVRELTRRAISIREDERGALAMDIHDDVGQCLLATKLDLQTTFARLARSVPVKADRDRILERMDTIALRIRQISHRLSPVGLRNLGLEDAIRNLVQIFQDANPAVEIQLDLEYLDEFFPDAWDVNLYRIVQEALTNAMRCADASQIILADELSAQRLSIRIRDNGRGFTPGKTPGGIGLYVMKERAHLLGGELVIHSCPAGSELNSQSGQEGTEVRVDINRRSYNRNGSSAAHDE